jgi:hypothetical protein
VVYEHRMPGGRGRALSEDQEAAIKKAVAGGKVSEAELGLLHAARMYADAQNSVRADEALHAASKKGRRR